MTESQSYSTVSGVQAYVGRGPYTATTTPTYNEVIGFLVEGAAAITATMAIYGSSYTPAADGNGIPASEVALTYLVQNMNSIAGAIRSIAAAESGEAPNSSQKITELMEVYKDLELRLIDFLRFHIGTGGVSADATTPSPTTYDFDMSTQRW